MFVTLMFLAGSVLTAVSPEGDGVIEGVVVRAADQTPVAGAEVVLRAKVGGQTLPAAETTADARGRFRFAHLAADGRCIYLPGANHDGVHYPGPGVRLSSSQRRAEVKVAVCDAVAFPNPLVVRRHTITLCPEPDALRVTESMLIDNPTSVCYVGQAAGKDAEPATLQLAIPADFQRVTFDSEFFGKRFSLAGGRLVTGIPWPPGRRELTFSYLLGNTQRHYVWQRPLDLPSAERARVDLHRPAGPGDVQSGRCALARKRPNRLRVGRANPRCRIPVARRIGKPASLRDGVRALGGGRAAGRLGRRDFSALGPAATEFHAMKTNAMRILDTPDSTGQRDPT